MSNGFEKFKGQVKERVGDVTGNRRLKREGKADQASARVKQTSAHAVDRVRDALHRDRAPRPQR
jgi:uncharacterized protein YjbJ (UPF0337 family)